MKELSSRYQPKDFEERLYKEWKEGGYFKADNESEKESFTIVMPPPNVTGALHMGHALNNTIQDILTRTKRMQGYEALWLPGTDHASISTESLVVKKIESEGKSKEDLGREGFLEEAWAWTHKYGGTINHQLEMLGCSCDWSREAFTLDENLSEAVTHAFLHLYEKGYIYKGHRIVNYCPSCQTVISDAEVEHVDTNGHLWHIRYPYVDGEGEVIIATTRPETLLGDLAVAVSPTDERYQEQVGKKVILPLVGREIPVVADEFVDEEFGTGIVKITPSHDPNDFEVGERHNLGFETVILDDGTIAEGYGRYSGMDRFEARKAIVEDLEKEGFLVKVEDHEHAVGHCERCDTVIEPLISEQFFVAMKELAKSAIEVYKNGDLNIVPDHFGKTYLNWLENIRDWTISRQLWWGHQLPVYYHNKTGEMVVAKENPDPEKYTQDSDTLDTWFSSALWPFSTLGWPKETKDFEKFFPTSVLVTGHDIIFFWVIRMVFSSLFNTGELPFKDVYFNGMVLDADGHKMSKSLGNGIDPLDMIDKYGTDALRFTLVTGNTPGNDIRFRDERIERARNFANKLWNASRFVLMNLKSEEIEEDVLSLDLKIEDQWILSRKNTVAKEMKDYLEAYEIGLAADYIHHFIWDEYCDWYIEMAKPRLYSENEEDKKVVQSVLLHVLMGSLKLLHPFMPFITEEIYQSLPNKKDMLIVEDWPVYQEEFHFEKEEKAVELFIDAARIIRNRRAEMDIAPSKKSELIVVTEDDFVKTTFENLERDFDALASTSKIAFVDSYDEENAIVMVKDNYQMYIPLDDLIDYEKELERLEKELDNLENEIKRAEGMLSNKGFVDNAPEHLIQEEKDKLESFKEMKEQVVESIEQIKDR